MPDSDIRVLELEAYFTVEKAREPLRFGASVMDEVTLCHVRARVENRLGQVSDGWGAIFLSDFWAFPTPPLEHAVRDQVMRRVTLAICRRLADHKEFAHPLDIFWAFEPELDKVNAAVGAEMQLADAMPFLGALRGQGHSVHDPGPDKSWARAAAFGGSRCTTPSSDRRGGELPAVSSRRVRTRERRASVHRRGEGWDGAHRLVGRPWPWLPDRTHPPRALSTFPIQKVWRMPAAAVCR